MSGVDELQSICRTIRDNYSACDISDALLKLNVPRAGCLHPDIAPLHRDTHARKPLRLVAPLSTVRYERKARVSNQSASGDAPVPPTSNIRKGTNWTDSPPRGNVVLVQQPDEQTHVALVGDIMVTRLKSRGVQGIVVDGRTRDVESCAACCEDGTFQMWSRGYSPASPSIELVPWAFDVTLHFGDLSVQPGDILCADEGDRAVVVIPKAVLTQALDLLPALKEASDGVLEDVRGGMSLPEAVGRHPKFYSNY